MIRICSSEVGNLSLFTVVMVIKSELMQVIDSTVLQPSQQNSTGLLQAKGKYLTKADWFPRHSRYWQSTKLLFKYYIYCSTTILLSEANSLLISLFIVAVLKLIIILLFTYTVTFCSVLFSSSAPTKALT